MLRSVAMIGFLPCVVLALHAWNPIVATLVNRAVTLWKLHHYSGLKLLERARERGVPAEKIEAVARAGVQLDHWLTGFRSVEEGVAASVRMVREHPLLPPGVPVHGLIIDPETGKLDLLIDGNNPGG